VLAVGAPVHAENALESSSPADGENLPASPPQITLTFAEPLGTTNTARLICNGTAVPIGDPSVGPDRRTLVIAVPNALPNGSCDLRWVISAPEGGIAESSSNKLAFTVGGAGAPVTTAAGATPTTVAGGAAPQAGAPATPGTTVPANSAADEPSGSQGPAGLARLVALIGLSILFGSLVVIALAWPEGVEYVLTVRFLRSAWIIAIVGAYLHAVALTVLNTDTSLGAALIPTSWMDIADSGPGAAAIGRVAFTAATAWVIARPERVIDQVTQLAALALPAMAVATFGFSRSGGDLALIGYAAGIVHALAMSVWVGGLVLLTRVVLAGPGEEDLVHAVRGYSRISTAAIVATVLSGAVQLYRLDRGALFSSGHGRVVLLKVLIVVAVVFVGTKARQLVRDKLSRANSLGPKMAVRLRRSLGTEAMACMGTLVLSAWLLGLTPANVDPPSIPDVRSRQVFEGEGDFEITVALTQRVGPNAVRVEVLKPSVDINDITIQFMHEDVGTPVTFFVPALTGPGAVYLPIAEGMPLDAPGTWTVTVFFRGQQQGTPKSIEVTGTAPDTSASTTTPTTVLTQTSLVSTPSSPTSGPSTSTGG
jgi:copper transport protein